MKTRKLPKLEDTGTVVASTYTGEEDRMEVGRPWGVHRHVWDRCMALFPVWLRERGGIVVYQNRNFNMLRFGDKSFLPARFVAEEDNGLHDAPEWINELPSQRQHRVDVVKLDEFGGDTGKAIAACFRMEES